MRPFFNRIRTYVAAMAAVCSLGQPVLAQTQASWTAQADDALLFDMRLGQYRLGDGIRGYQTPSGVCVDFADVILALDLPIRLDKKLRRATGWAFEESRTLLIDRDNNTVQIMNKTTKLAESAIHDTPEGWCIDAQALAGWLGVKMDPDTSNALLFVRADQKLPVELAAERRVRAAKVRPIAQFDLKSLPQTRVSFSGIKTPSVDVVASLGGLRQGKSGARFDLGYELYATGEVGPVAYDARLASNRRGLPESLRVRAYRTDPDGGLLGPLKATEIAAGDVSGVSTPLVAQSAVGRGATITNRPVERPDSFDRTDFRGELPVGWDAELYRNGQLLGFAINRADGRYEFLDVPLLYGQNRFEIVLYGPQGQVRREERTIPVGLDSIPPKTTWYWAGVHQDGRDLIGLGRGPLFGTGGWRGTLGLERGLNTRTSVAFGVHSLEVREVGRRNFLEASIRRAIGPALFEVSGSAESHGGFAMRGQAIGELGQTYFTAETVKAWGGFRSDRILSNVTGVHSIGVDHSFNIGRSTIPFHFDTKYITRTSGIKTIENAARLSTNVGRTTLTTEVNWRIDRRRFGPDPPDEIGATLRANARIGGLRLRGETRFRLSPSSRFENATLVGEWSGRGDRQQAADWRAEIGYDRPLRRARAGLGYVRRFDKVALTASLEAATDGSMAAGLNIAFSLGPDPRRGGGIRVTSNRIAAHGQTLARVFRDTNGDGIHQDGEPFEKEVQLSAGRVPVDGLTDVNGEVIIDNLQSHQPVLIGIDASSLPDPLIQPKGPGIVVTPRPGIVMTVELPLVSAGEVDGTLVREGGGNLEGVDLELVDGGGHVIARSRSDFDGFFLFESVPYGRYSVRVSQLAAAAARLGVSLEGDVRVDGDVPSFHLGIIAARTTETRTAIGAE
jgi:hypothetical protein